MVFSGKDTGTVENSVKEEKNKHVNPFLTPYKKLLTQKQTIDQNAIPRIIKLSGENIITFGKLSWIQYEKHDPQE